MELLLSYIEFNQLQTYFMQITNGTDIGTTDTHKHIVEVNGQMDVAVDCLCQKLIQFPETIPLSEIVEEEHDIQMQTNSEIKERLGIEAKIKSHKLYVKYIQLNCALEINISGELRQQMDQILSDLDALIQNEVIGIKELYEWFEKPKMEMRLLLLFSLNRFKKEKSFDQVRKILHKENITETV